MSCSGLIYTFDSSVANVNLFVAFSDSASEGALQAYEAIPKAGGLRASKDAMMIAASKQASLATPQSYLQKPPSILQRGCYVTSIHLISLSYINKIILLYIKYNLIYRYTATTLIYVP